MTKRRKLLRLAGVFLVVAALAVLVFQSVRNPPLPEDFTDFVERYRSYHENGEVEGLAGLVHWGDTSEKARRIFRYAMEEECRWPLKDIQARPVQQGDVAEVMGEASIPTGITPQWRIWILLETGDAFTSSWLAGRTPDGIRLIAGSVKE